MNFNSVDARLAWQLSPEVVFEPTILDFGQLTGKVKTVRELSISNPHGSLHGCSVVCDNGTPWFRIVHLQPIEDVLTGVSRLKLVIEVDTSLLQASEHYTGWIEVKVEHVAARIQVKVTVDGKQRASSPRTHWLQTFALTVMAVILVSGVLSLLSSTRAVALTSRLLPDFATLRPWPTRALLSFAADVGSELTLHTTTVAANHQQERTVVGWSPAWSADGLKLAFLGKPAGVPQLYLLDASDHAPLQLTSSGEPKSAPAWSPDGRKVAFLAGVPARAILQIVNSRSLVWGSGTPAFGEHDPQVAAVNAMMRQRYGPANTTGTVKRFAWSPDSSKLLFDYYQTGQAQILQVSANGEITEIAVNSWSPTWSPDGGEMAAVSANGLFRTSLAAPQQRVYLSRYPASTPAWSPDGNRIAFLVDKKPAATLASFDLWLVGTTGGDERFLAANCITFAWSPDGQQLAYVTGDITKHVNSPITADTPGPLGLYYLWTISPGHAPTLLAEINDPTIAWRPLP